MSIPDEIHDVPNSGLQVASSPNNLSSVAVPSDDAPGGSAAIPFDKLASHVRRPLNELFFKWLSLDLSQTFINQQIRGILAARNKSSFEDTLLLNAADAAQHSNNNNQERSPPNLSSVMTPVAPLSPTLGSMNPRLPSSPVYQPKTTNNKQFNSPPKSPRVPRRSGSPMRSLDLDGPGSSRRAQWLHRKLQGNLQTGDVPVPSKKPQVKQFYFPDGMPMAPKTRNMLLEAIKDTFLSAEQHNGTHGLSLHEFFPITLRVCELPSYCNSALFMAVLEFAQRFSIFPHERKQSGEHKLSKRMAALNRKMVETTQGSSSGAESTTASPQTPSSGSSTLSFGSGESKSSMSSNNSDMLESNPVVTMGDFLRYWEHNIAGYTVHQRLFRILKKDNASVRWLERGDFEIIVQEIVARHPGLEFLEATPEFQEHYIVTVIARVFYQINVSGNERITLAEFTRSNFLEKLAELDKEDDVNKINDYFSYEHFYVIYCKFWELDTDHDNLLDITDLIRYEDYALSSRAVRRVVDGYTRPLRSKMPGKLCYEDFVVFLISDIDKDSKVSLDYWFKVVDLDGDGVISYYELEHFVVEQRQRMQSISQEEVLIPDMICQLMDIVHPANATGITKQDIANSKSCSLFFNMLLNLNRHILHEQRDPMRIKRIHDTAEVFSSWDRYVIGNYMALAEVEAEGYDYGYPYAQEGGMFEGDEPYDDDVAAAMRAEQFGQIESWMQQQQNDAEQGEGRFQHSLRQHHQQSQQLHIDDEHNGPDEDAIGRLVDGVVMDDSNVDLLPPAQREADYRVASLQDSESDVESWSPSLLEQISDTSPPENVRRL